MYGEYAQFVVKIDTFLRSLGINPDGAEGRNDPRADLILALLSDMHRDEGWVAMTNCLYEVATNDAADPLFRLMAVAHILHIVTTHPIASQKVQGNDMLAADCKQALLSAARHLTRQDDHIGIYGDLMDEVFGAPWRMQRRHPSILYRRNELRLQKLSDQSRLVLYEYGDHVASIDCRDPQNARVVLVEWKGAGYFNDATYQHFLEHIDGLFKS